ncbi:thioesterase [Paenibacillus oryzae]|uniref:Thioesterase n=1 Tax=Paenibacillus oryzae TaxID=1844972 RepID=A0A1A5YBK7_9BACL|nr:thioesterase family protein [Paenibacillus oryzae]OBR62968.1 thioesterase [Paenibacillus oryzae]
MLNLKNWYCHPLRVRYQECDSMGVVFHANYVTWFEIGRTEWIRQRGYSYKAIEEHGLLLPVVDLQCSYLAPARYDDMVLVCTTVAEVSPLKLTFQSQIRKVAEGQFQPCFAEDAELPGELLVEGATRHVWLNSQWKPVRLSKQLPELYAAIGGQ